MNERIKQLAEQATIVGDTKHSMDIPSWYLEKFAELIVKRMIDNVECHTDMYDTPDIKFVCERIVNSIKFDFGVEL